MNDIKVIEALNNSSCYNCKYAKNFQYCGSIFCLVKARAKLEIYKEQDLIIFNKIKEI